jgi:hypothetical protein
MISDFSYSLLITDYEAIRILVVNLARISVSAPIWANKADSDRI